MNFISRWLNRRAGRCEYTAHGHWLTDVLEVFWCGHPKGEKKCCVRFSMEFAGSVLRSNGLTDMGMCPLGRIHWNDHLTDEGYQERLVDVKKWQHMLKSIAENLERLEKMIIEDKARRDKEAIINGVEEAYQVPDV